MRQQQQSQEVTVPTTIQSASSRISSEQPVRVCSIPIPTASKANTIAKFTARPLLYLWPHKYNQKSVFVGEWIHAVRASPIPLILNLFSLYFHGFHTLGRHLFLISTLARESRCQNY